MLSSKIENEDQQEEEDFRCPKCKWYFSNMTKPYILPCNHNICLKCIDLLIKEKKTICPICKSEFNKKERDSFQVNIVFLNILLKIMQSKFILCKKCNKIFYWKEHYNKCDQSNFTETNKLFNDIKTSCEGAIKIINLFNNQKNILVGYKNNVFENIKRTLKEISDLYKKETNLEFKKLFFISKNIDFNKSKKEIISFLKLCLSYKNYFDENEINSILEKYNYNSPQKRNYPMNNNWGLSPINSQILPHSPFHTRIANMNIDNYGEKKTSTVMISQLSKGNQKILNFRKDNNYKNDYKITRNLNMNNLQREDKSLNILNKILNDNNEYNNNVKIRNNINYMNVNNINNMNDNFKKNWKNFRKSSNTVFLSSNTKPKDKKNKFNIYDILNVNEPNEENDKKKIIVGLKDIKVISNNKVIKKEYENNNNIIHKQNKSLNSTNNNYINNNYSNNKKSNRKKNLNTIIYNNKIKINKNNLDESNFNLFNDDESEASTIRLENPLSLLLSNDFTKRVYPLKAEDKRKRYFKIKENENFENQLNNINNKNSKHYSSKIINNSACLIKGNNNIDNDNDDDKINLSTMNKLFENFNKIRDILNEINNFNNYLTFTSNYVNKNIELRISLLWSIILNDYNLLLNEISYNFTKSHRRYIATLIENTKKICIYDANLNKFKIKDFDKILTQYQYLDNSISIDYDDNDSIFISGGLEKSKYNCSNAFLILKWSKESIEYSDTLPERKAYHSILYYDNNLYLIGGINSNKKVSKECYFFSLSEKKWYNLPKLNVGRANSSICIYNNSIMYVFRGRDDNNVLDSIEYIKIKLCNIRSSWNICKPKDYGYVWNASENSLVMIMDKDKILICGGEDINGNLFNDTFLFETSTKKVYKGIDLCYPASFRSQGCLFQGKFYCVDFKREYENEQKENMGFGGVHIYDPKENIWSLN